MSSKELPLELVNDLERVQADPKMRLILLTGSFARGDSRKYSDIDIVCLLSQPDFTYPPYTLKYYGNQLVSLSFATVRDWEERLNRYEEAKLLRPAILHARILYEYSPGIYENLILKVKSTNYPALDTAQSQRIESTAVGYLEELHKLLNGVYYNDEYLILYAIFGLNKGGFDLLNLLYPVEFVSENHYFAQLLDAVHEDDQQIKDLWRKMWCLDQRESMQARGLAAIEFYLRVLNLSKVYLSEEGLDTVKTAEAIAGEILADSPSLFRSN